MPFWGHRVAKELGSRCITGSNSVDADPFLAEGPRKIVGPANDCCLGGGIRAPSTPKCCNRTHVDDSPSRSPETGQKRLCQHHGSKDVASEIAKPRICDLCKTRGGRTVDPPALLTRTSILLRRERMLLLTSSTECGSLRSPGKASTWPFHRWACLGV